MLSLRAIVFAIVAVLSLYFVFLTFGSAQIFTLDQTTSQTQKMAIIHIVLFQFKPAVTTATIKEVGLDTESHDRSHNRTVDFTTLPCAEGFLHSPNRTEAIYHFLDWRHQ